MKYIISLFTILIFSLVTSCAGGTTEKAELITQKVKTETAAIKNYDHSAWDALLKKYVDNTGAVDYHGFKKDSKALKNYLDYLGSKPIDKTLPANEKLAYYINLYNASIVELIIDNDQPQSIKDLGSLFSPVWKKDFINLGEEVVSLDDIEKGILQKMGDPRIHFAINCASYSCPKLQNEAFTSANMNSLMNKAAAEFINSDKNNLSDLNNPRLSKIFNWYKSDFTATGKSVIEYINQFTKRKVKADASIDYLDYDWSLNKQ